MCQCEVLCETISKEDWDSFYLGTIKSPMQIYNACSIGGDKWIPLFVRIKENDKIVFQWLLYLKGKKGLYILVANAEPVPVNMEYMKMALDKIQSKYHPFRFDFYSITLSRLESESILRGLGFDHIYPYASNIVSLDKTEDELFADVHSKHRNVIRKAVKSGVIIREKEISEANIRIYKEISAITYKRSHGKDISNGELNAYIDSFKESKNIRMFFAESEDGVQAASLMLVTDYVAIYWHGASCNHPITGAANLLHWETMKQLKKEGVKYYDFGGLSINPAEGTKGEGINRFKTRFGGEIKTYYGGVKIYSKLFNGLYKILMLLRDAFRR